MRFFVRLVFRLHCASVLQYVRQLVPEQLGRSSAAITLSYGQVTEILFVLLMPWLLVRWGPKHLFAIGLLAWRFAMPALPWEEPQGSRY